MRTERWKDGEIVEVIEKPDDKERQLRAVRATVNQMAMDGEMLLTEVEAEYAKRKATIEAMPIVKERHLIRDEVTGELKEVQRG